ncbi:MAG: HAD-IA family hydrolase [Chloroflexota bacterium]
MIKTLFIDLDGVLRIWGPEQDNRTEQFGLPHGAIRQIAFAPERLLPTITGRISDDEWRTSIAEQLHRQFPYIDAVQAVQAWSRPIGTVDQAMLEVVRSCRQRAKILLITNATSRLPSDLDQLGLSNEFDYIINSSTVGAAKPNARIFTAALHIASATATETLFIDDSAGHVDAATKLGFKGHIYQDIYQARQVLQDHKLL